MKAKKFKNSFKKAKKQEPFDHRKGMVQFKGIKDPYDPVDFTFFKCDSQAKYPWLGFMKTCVRRLSLWMCSKLERISFLDRYILKSDLSNFHKISPALFRGGQPLGQGFFRLKHLGIKTVINLRAVDTDQFHVESAGLRYFHISFRPHLPRDIDVIRFLKIMKNQDNHPVYLHCYHGSDRTGMLCAIYRIFFEGWHKDKAIYEMIHGGFGFHLFFQHNLISYLKKLDIEDMKVKAELV